MTSLQRAAAQGSRLRTRLEARYHQLLNTFQESVREFNKQIDEEQIQHLTELKKILQSSHHECEEVLLQEFQRVDAHKNLLDKQKDTNSISGDVLLDSFTDKYHQKGEVRIDDSVQRLHLDRERLIAIGVGLRQQYENRLNAITNCETIIEGREKERLVQVRKALVDLVEALTKIGYTSINGSHALAQRAIHGINENLCKNHSGRKILLQQLRSREVLRQRRYSRQLADVYGASLELMVFSSLHWVVTLLQTSYFRRPRSRTRAAIRVGGLATNIRRDGAEFLRNVGTTVQSLRRAREIFPHECGQICGGTLPDGWLRGFDGTLTAPVFSVSPIDVAVEWRVKANVLVRNIVAQCVALSDEVRHEEQELCDEATSLLQELRSVLQWICEPQELEAAAWSDASMQNQNHINDNENNSIDEAYVRFTRLNTTLLTRAMGEVDSRVVPLIDSIKRESDWFADTVASQLNTQHTTLEATLLRGPRNVLLTFQCATEALEKTTCEALGGIRLQLIAMQEARKDHEDTLQYVEAELAQRQLQLQRAATADAAEVLFVDALSILERIASQHVEFHRYIVQSLQRLASEGPAEVERQCMFLLQLLGIESTEVYEQRLEQKRREREAAAAAALAAAESNVRKGRAKEVVIEYDSETDEEDTTPSYPTITSSDGQIYYIVAPMALDNPQPPVKSEETPPPQQQQQQQQSPQKGRNKSVRSSSSTKKSSPQQQQQSGKYTGKNPQMKRQSSPESQQSTAVVVLETPSTSFIQACELLLKEGIREVQDDTIFLSPNSVELWRDMLRREILNWTVHLRRASLEHIQGQCTTQKAVIDSETNEVLRHHRRRPATLQAEAYEARLREIANIHMTEEKYCTRLRGRVARLELVWLSMVKDGELEQEQQQQQQEEEEGVEKEKDVGKTHHEEYNDDEDDDKETVITQLEENSSDLEAYDNKLFEQLQELEKTTSAANSVNALLTQERTFANLVSASVDRHTRHYHAMMEKVTRKQDALESECRGYLLSRGITVPSNLDELQDNKELVDNKDNVCKQTIEILIRLNNAAKAVKERLTAAREHHLRRIDAAKASYSTVYEQNVGELQMLARLQEAFARLKVQVHSLLTLSEASELNIEEILKEFEEKLSEPALLHDFSNILKEITSRDYGAVNYNTTEAQLKVAPGGESSSGGTNSGKLVVAKMTQDRMRLAETELNERLTEMKLEIQRQIRGSDLAKVLRLMDRLREALYVRGCHLNCLQYGVEFFNVPQENYIEPRLGVAVDTSGDDGNVTVPAPPPPSLLSGQNRITRRSKSSAAPNSALASLYATAEPPEVTAAEIQLRDWIASLKAQVSGIVEQHFSICPQPLRRLLPGMKSGNPDDLIQLCKNLCEQQEQRAQQHVEQATRRYREQVQRVFNAVKKIPGYMINSTYTISATALEHRISAVFNAFSSLYGESDALRAAYDRLIKVTLASNYNRNRLVALCDAEGSRRNVTQKAIEKFWGYALREMEDEATMHAARSLNVNNSFFALMRGLVTPDNLKPTEDDGNSGHHRSLKRLIQLKEREERAKEIQQQFAPKRERRLQETMPRSKRSVGSISDKLPTGKKADSSAAAGGTGNLNSGIDALGGPLPLPATREIEHGRVPLRAFRPLESFNAAHPEAAMKSPIGEFIPSFLRRPISPRPPVSSSGRRNKGEGVTITSSTSPLEENGGTVAIVAPATLLHREIATLTQQSVELFNKSSAEAASKAIRAFEDWSKREAAWEATWSAAISRLEK